MNKVELKHLEEYPTLSKAIYEYSQKNGCLTIPEGITSKFFTLHKDNKPYQNTLIFSDGSEMSISLDGCYFWSELSEWEIEEINTPKIKD